MSGPEKNPLRLGMVGCDTSHCQMFGRILNDPSGPDYYKGARIVKAFPGGSPDWPLSASRVQGIASELSEKYNVRLVDSVEEAVSDVDAILLESSDGRVHLEQFRRCLSAGKPVFIDKPLAVSTSDAREIATLADNAGVPFFSASSLRWAGDLGRALADEALGDVIGIDVQGPMAFQPPIPEYFWYGIHTAEMLYQTLGAGCRQVTAVSTEAHDVIVGIWGDGRIGTLRGNRCGNNVFAGTVHRKNGSQVLADANLQTPPYYHRLVHEIMGFFQTGLSPVPRDQLIEVVRFLEAAGESRKKGCAVLL